MYVEWIVLHLDFLGDLRMVALSAGIVNGDSAYDVIFGASQSSEVFLYIMDESFALISD